MSNTISVSQIPAILRQTFKTKKILNSGNAVGYTINLLRCPLPIRTEDAEVTGADLIAMLAKLDEWEKTIGEVRKGLMQIITDQLERPQ